MKFTTIYSETLSLWPEHIEISDGKDINKEGGFFLNLSEAWRKAEQQAENLTDWHQLMVWAIFSELHSIAIKSYLEGKSKVLVLECNAENTEKFFAENLYNSESDYPETMKSVYVNDLISPKN